MPISDKNIVKTIIVFRIGVSFNLRHKCFVAKD
jgi:hypothetical protein